MINILLMMVIMMAKMITAIIIIMIIIIMIIIIIIMIIIIMINQSINITGEFILYMLRVSSLSVLVIKMTTRHHAGRDPRFLSALCCQHVYPP